MCDQSVWHGTVSWATALLFLCLGTECDEDKQWDLDTNEREILVKL